MYMPFTFDCIHRACMYTGVAIFYQEGASARQADENGNRRERGKSAVAGASSKPGPSQGEVRKYHDSDVLLK